MGKKPATAESMSAKQRDISVSEFFAKNRHLLGFDNPRKALLTTVKEAVDNALDACEEAEILPDITVRIEELAPARSVSAPTRYRVTILDNGPGIVRKQVENIFGRLLYGSKFHRLKMSRGQQGIGISAAGMYGLMTTGRPMVIMTKPGKRKKAHHMVLAMDTSKNRPEVTLDEETDEFPETSSGTGTQVSIELEGKYIKGKASVDAYLEQTAIANPHAKITFIPPAKGEDADTPSLASTVDAPDATQNMGGDAKAAKGDGVARGEGVADAGVDVVRTIELDDRVIYPRGVEELPPETVEIKPHPHGVELGMFLQKLKNTDEKQLGGFLKNEFCRISPKVSSEVYKQASRGNGPQVTGGTWIKTIESSTAEKVYRALQESKLQNPPTDCLAPIGVRTMLAGMLKGVKAEFYAASTRTPAVYRGNPFQIEAAIGFGGDLPGDQTARIIRFANRVPLLYQQSACCAFKSVVETGWKNYGLQQPRGGAPVGPLVVMIHMASVWVPFTSESKEAIADYDEIRKEMKLALQECGRKLGTYVRRRQKMRREGEKRDVFTRYIGEIAKAAGAITEHEAQPIYDALMRQAERKTALADAILDDEGKIVGNKQQDDGNGRLDNDEGVIIVSPSGGGGGGAAADAGGGEASANGSGHRISGGAAHKAGGVKASPRSRSKKTGKKSAKKGGARKQASAKGDDEPGGKLAFGEVESKDGGGAAKASAKTSVRNKGMKKPRVRLGEPALFGD